MLNTLNTNCLGSSELAVQRKSASRQRVCCWVKMSTFWGAAALWRVLAVAHLHACEAEPRAVLLQNRHEVCVAVPLPRVVVSGRQLSRVHPRLEPPVHPRQLGAQVAGRLKFVHHMPIRVLHIRPHPLRRPLLTCTSSFMLLSSSISFLLVKP